MKLKKILTGITPPFIMIAAYKLLVLIGIKKEINHVYSPSWHTIVGGPLRECKFLIDTYDNLWQKEILLGTYDKFFFDILKTLRLQDAVIFDIGAHIGYHSLCFASIVGKCGRIHSFEPNIFNNKRMLEILENNSDLKDRIVLHHIALSDKNGEINFWFSKEIDNGRSSGGFISSSSTPTSMKDYLEMGFVEAMVPTMTLDKFIINNSIQRLDVLKIDVEGAEFTILQGFTKTISKFKPVLMIEVHSIKNMYNIYSWIQTNRYNLILLNENALDHRCFFMAVPNA